MLSHNTMCTTDPTKPFEFYCYKYLSYNIKSLNVQFSIYNTPLPRLLTAQETEHVKKFIPMAANNNLRIFAEITPYYNSLSWVFGYTDRNMWPANNSFINVYQASQCLAKAGLVQTVQKDLGVIVEAWGADTDHILHFSIYLNDTNVWSSKCGSDFGLFHARGDLYNGVFGNAVAWYRLSGVQSLQSQKELELETKIESDKYFSDVQKKYIAEAVDKISYSTKDRFNEVYPEWVKNCIKHYGSMSSSHFCSNLDEVVALKALGQDLITLLINQLSHNDFFALAVYNTVQSNAKLVITEVTDTVDPCNVNSQVVHTVDLWLAEHGVI